MSNARFSILQSRAVEDKRISNAQFRTLAALGMYGDKDGYCFPHLKTLGDALGKSKQAVSKDIQALSELGYVEITPQYRKDGSRMGNLYRLIFDSPRQPDDDPHQWDVDTRQPQMLTPVNVEDDTRQLNEVDALTPHLNASSNAPLEDDERKLTGEVFRKFEESIGSIYGSQAETLGEMIDTHGHDSVLDAIDIGKRKGARHVNYIVAVLENKRDGGDPENWIDELLEAVNG